LCAINDRLGETLHNYKISLADNSIYIICSHSSSISSSSQLFEIPLHEHKTEKLVPKWFQYFLIAGVVGIGIIYMKYKQPYKKK
jgi:hypothetical protein